MVHNNTFSDLTSGLWIMVTTMEKTVLNFFSEFFDAIFVDARPEINIRPKVGGAITTRSISSLKIVKS